MAGLVGKGRIAFANDPITAGLIRNILTETYAAMSEVVGPQVVDALAADPTIAAAGVAAAAAGVEAAITDGRIVLTEDTRLQYEASIPGVMRASVDAAGNHFWIAVNDVDGGPTPEGLELLRRHWTDAAASYVCWGDSMSDDGYGTGLSYPKQLAALLGKPVAQRGRSGDTSTEIAIRQGGIPILLTIPGGVLPAGAVDTDVTIDYPSGPWSASTQPARVYTGTYGGVACTLTKRQDGTWFLHRTTAGTAVNVPPRTVFLMPITDKGSTAILWAGRNDYPHTTASPNVAAMAKQVKDGGGKFLVVSILTKDWEKNGPEPGQTEHDAIVAENLNLQTLFPREFVDLRKHLILNGLAVAGITPTTADTAAIAADTIPPSLFYDGLHLNGTGRLVVAKFIQACLIERGLA